MPFYVKSISCVQFRFHFLGNLRQGLKRLPFLLKDGKTVLPWFAHMKSRLLVTGKFRKLVLIFLYRYIVYNSFWIPDDREWNFRTLNRLVRNALCTPWQQLCAISLYFLVYNVRSVSNTNNNIKIPICMVNMARLRLES